LEILFTFLFILIVWLFGRKLVPAAIPRSKIKMVSIGFLGGLIGNLLGGIIKLGPDVYGSYPLPVFIGVASFIFWTGLAPLAGRDTHSKT
jgi:hypothetical protein